MASPFTTYTNRGPRFTIIRAVPYDRRQTTLAAFAMCSRCQSEYRDAADLRFHAARSRRCGPTFPLTSGLGPPLALSRAASKARPSASAQSL